MIAFTRCFAIGVVILPALFLPVFCSAQEARKHAPTREETAVELLTAVRDGAGAADPVLSPFLLWRAADAWAAIDKARARKYLDEAFERASAMQSGLPGEPKGRLQTWIAASVLPLDIERASEMMQQVYIGAGKNASDPRGPLLSAILGALMAKGSMDEAVELQRSAGARGEYPFDGLNTLFKKLPEGDSRRVILFGDAIGAYQTRPSPAFGKLVAAHWKTLEQSQVTAALDSIVRQTEKYSDEQNDFQISYTTAQGVATLPTRADTELFDIIVPLRALEPGKLQEILASRKDLAHTVEMLPDGLDYSKVQGASMGPAKRVQSAGAFLNGTTITARALQALPSSPDQAFELAKTIPGGQMRAACYAQMARVLLKDHDADAHRALSLAMDSLVELKDNELDLATQNWRLIVQIAGEQMKQPELAREALTHWLATVQSLSKVDSNPDDPNTAPMEFWPSTRAWRDVAVAAVKLDGTGVRALFEKAPDANALLILEAAAAAELEGRSQPGMTMSIHPKR